MLKNRLRKCNEINASEMLFNAIFTQQSRIMKFYSAAAWIRLYRCRVIYGSSLLCGLVEGVSFMLFLISVPACQTYQPAGSMSSVCMSQRWEVVREWQDRSETKSTSPILGRVCLCCQRVNEANEVWNIYLCYLWLDEIVSQCFLFTRISCLTTKHHFFHPSAHEAIILHVCMWITLGVCASKQYFNTKITEHIRNHNIWMWKKSRRWHTLNQNTPSVYRKELWLLSHLQNAKKGHSPLMLNVFSGYKLYRKSPKDIPSSVSAAYPLKVLVMKTAVV